MFRNCALFFLAAHIGFRIPWAYDSGAVLHNCKQRVERAERGESFALIDTVSARSGIFFYEVRDSLIEPGIRYSYRIVNTKAGFPDARGGSHSGLYLLWEQGSAEWELRRMYSGPADNPGAHLLAVRLVRCPYRGADAWTITWIRGPDYETVEARNAFDFTNDGRVLLSDLVRFGTLPHDLSDFASFGRMYGKLARFQFSRRWTE